MESLDVQKMYAALFLKRQLVGVKLAASKTEFEQYEAKELIAPMPYCVAVRCAMGGAALKFTKECSGCAGSTRALGLKRPTAGYYDGSEGCILGLYQDVNVASDVAKQMKIIEQEIYGVIVKPLEQYEEEPDVVLAVSDTRTIMRIIQGYTYMFGMQPEIQLTGNQAVCVECTAYPMRTGKINLSLFCSGTRHLAGWDDTEAMVGIPYQIFADVVEGIMMTANAVEEDERKRDIISRLKKLGCDTSAIKIGQAYYLKK